MRPLNEELLQITVPEKPIRLVSHVRFTNEEGPEQRARSSPIA